MSLSATPTMILEVLIVVGKRSALIVPDAMLVAFKPVIPEPSPINVDTDTVDGKRSGLIVPLAMLVAFKPVIAEPAPINVVAFTTPKVNPDEPSVAYVESPAVL